MASNSATSTSKSILDRFGNDGREGPKQFAPGTVVSEQSTSVGGAEQDRWQGHFGLNDPAATRDAAKDGAWEMFHRAKRFEGAGAEQDVHAGHFAMGFDGQERMRKMLNAQGVGAEQERYAGHFGLPNTAGMVDKAKNRLARSVKENQGAENMS